MRRKILPISGELLEQLLKGPRLGAISQVGFPEDGKVVGCCWSGRVVGPDEPRLGTVNLIIESSSFDEAPDGIYPEMTVRFMEAWQDEPPMSTRYELDEIAGDSDE